MLAPHCGWAEASRKYTNTLLEEQECFNKKKLDSKEICFAVMAVANRQSVHMTMNECHIYCPH